MSYGDGFIKSIFHKDEIGFELCTRIMGHLCFICLAHNCKRFVITLILHVLIFNGKMLPIYLPCNFKLGAFNFQNFLPTADVLFLLRFTQFYRNKRIFLFLGFTRDLLYIISTFLFPFIHRALTSEVKDLVFLRYNLDTSGWNAYQMISVFRVLAFF